MKANLLFNFVKMNNFAKSWVPVVEQLVVVNT